MGCERICNGMKWFGMDCKVVWSGLSSGVGSVLEWFEMIVQIVSTRSWSGLSSFKNLEDGLKWFATACEVAWSDCKYILKRFEMVCAMILRGLKSGCEIVWSVGIWCRRDVEAAQIEREAWIAWKDQGRRKTFMNKVMGCYAPIVTQLCDKCCKPFWTGRQGLSQVIMRWVYILPKLF